MEKFRSRIPKSGSLYLQVQELKCYFWVKSAVTEQQNGALQRQFKDKFIYKWDNQKRKEAIHFYVKRSCVSGWEEEGGFIPAGVSSHGFSSLLFHTHRISSLHPHVVLPSPNPELLTGARRLAARIRDPQRNITQRSSRSSTMTLTKHSTTSQKRRAGAK